MYPLVLQFARWLSQGSSDAVLPDDAGGRRNKTQPPTTFLKDSAAVLFEALCEGLGDAVQSSLRTVCADALVELFNWISKQSANEGGSSTSLHRILAMARHPSPQKRAGAVVAIWRLRKFLQADPALLNCEVRQLSVAACRRSSSGLLLAIQSLNVVPLCVRWCLQLGFTCSPNASGCP